MYDASNASWIGPLILMTIVKNYSVFSHVCPLASLNVADNISATTTNSICLPPILPVPVTVASETLSLLSHDALVVSYYPCLKVLPRVNEISGSIPCASTASDSITAPRSTTLVRIVSCTLVTDVSHSTISTSVSTSTVSGSAMNITQA